MNTRWVVGWKVPMYDQRQTTREEFDRATCSEEHGEWRIASLQVVVQRTRVALIQGERTVRTNTNVDTFPRYQPIVNEAFQVSSSEMPSLMNQLAMETSNYMDMV